MASWVIIIIGVGWLSIVAKSIILPLIFGILLSIFMYPIDKRYLKIFGRRWISIPLTFCTIFIPIIIIMMLFSYEIVNIMESLPSIESNIKEGFDFALAKIDEAIPFANLSSKSLNILQSSTVSEGSLEVVRKGVASSAEFLVGTGLCFLYTFFLLYYRKSFKNFIIYQFEKENRTDTKDTLKEIKETVKSYVGGVGTVMIILSTLNTIGLTIIGIDHPLFWGVLAGILSIIPYVGTTLGGLLPFLYALSTTDTMWQPAAILVYYLVIQQLEGNFITPKIVGDKVDINPFFAILSIVILGTMWGVGGVILALPLISILRIILSQFQNTEPLSILMSSSIMDKGKFKKWAENAKS